MRGEWGRGESEMSGWPRGMSGTKARNGERGGGGWRGWRGGNERAAMDKSKRAPLEHMKRTCGLNE